MQLKEFGSVGLVYIYDKGLSRGNMGQVPGIRGQESGKAEYRKPETMNQEP
jgi:hypothetical protein